MEAEGSLLSPQETLSFLQDPFKDEKIEYRRNPVTAGNTFQDLPRLRETADNTERYMHKT